MSTTPQPWRLFDATVRRVERLSPSFLRLTFHGPDLARFAHLGLDSRCKLVLPAPDGGYDHLSRGDDWLADLRRLPGARQCPVRTYTVRAVRQDACEVDVDAVLHGHAPGPAGRWVATARPGDPIVLVGPDAAHPGPHGGNEWSPPRDVERVLLAGDETAVPAIASILESLPGDLRGAALLEVPTGGDGWQLAAPPRVEVQWLPRNGADHGSRLVPAVEAALDGLLPPAVRATGRGRTQIPDADLEDVDVDHEPLWEVPERDAPPTAARFHAWLAGEAGVVAELRRRLVRDRGVDRSAVAFMGYWRLGRPGG